MDVTRRSYRAGLRVTLRSTAAAYGYTLTIAATAAEVMTVHGKPATGELFLFVAGGLAAFATLEVILQATRAAADEGPNHAFPFAGALNVVSVTAGLGAATGVSHAVTSSLAWLLSPMAATAAYLLLVALQLTVVDAVRG